VPNTTHAHSVAEQSTTSRIAPGAAATAAAATSPDSHAAVARLDEASRCLHESTSGPGTAESFAAGDLDWEALLHVAEREGATGPLWRALAAREPALAGSLPAQPLRRCALVQEFRMRALASRLERTLDALGAAGIDVLLLKGAAVATLPGASFLSRPMGDIDLLVRPDTARRAMEVLQAAGWRSHEGGFEPATYDAHHHLPPMVHVENAALRLELHVELMVPGHALAFGAADLWRDARRVAVGAATALAPGRQAMLLHACVHFAWSHVLAAGSWRLCRDVATITREEFDWAGFVSAARASRAASLCHWALELASRVGRAPVPPDVVSALRPAMPAAVHRMLLRHFCMLATRGPATCPTPRLQRWLWELAVRPDAHGLGRARPWGRNAEFRRVGPGGGEPSARSRAGARRARWRRAGGHLLELAASAVTRA
jgi:hypothetical protein